MTLIWKDWGPKSPTSRDIAGIGKSKPLWTPDIVGIGKSKPLYRGLTRMIADKKETF